MSNVNIAVGTDGISCKNFVDGEDATYNRYIVAGIDIMAYVYFIFGGGNMLDAVSLMPKRSINNTGAKVYKSDTTC
jgi:hypothetical protein